MRRTRRSVARLPRERRESQILAAARQLIKERGYEDVAVAEIADRAGVVEGTIYRFFKDKRELLIRVAEEWFEELIAGSSELPSGGGVRDRLRHLIRRNLSIIRQEPSLSRFILMDLRLDPAFRATRLAELNRRFIHSVVDVLTEAVESGEFASDVPIRILRAVVFGSIEHLTWSFLRGDGDFSVDEAADGITDVIDRAMASRHRNPASGLDEIVARLEDVVRKLKPRGD